MFDNLSKIPQLMRLRKMAAAEKVEIEESGIRVVVRGDQKIESIEINGEANHSLVNLLNKALESAQKKAASKMMGEMGNLKGLLG